MPEGIDSFAQINHISSLLSSRPGHDHFVAIISKQLPILNLWLSFFFEVSDIMDKRHLHFKDPNILHTSDKNSRSNENSS